MNILIVLCVQANLTQISSRANDKKLALLELDIYYFNRGIEFMKFYVLNTNKRQHKQCEEDMIKNQTASAYGIPWGNSIKK